MTPQKFKQTEIGKIPEDWELEILSKIKECLDKLYREDKMLFYTKSKRILCERCIVFRLALYLQETFKDYFVDCDYNHTYFNFYQNGEMIESEMPGKFIRQEDGTFKKRFIDIIIHKRLNSASNNFICFEVKKKGNYKDTKKDVQNLRFLTSSGFNYKLGFYLILGNSLDQTKIRIFKNGEEIEIQTN